MTPLLENILTQPAALKAVARYQFGKGRDALERAASLLRTRQKLVISGMGASFFAGIGFAYAASSRHSSVQATEASELLYFLDSQIDADTALLLVSRSGESVEITKLLEKVRSREAAILGIANVPASTLTSIADQAMLIASPPDELVAIQTYTATVATFGLLNAALEGELDSAVPELERLSDLLQDWIPGCVRNRESWDEFLNTGGPHYLLSRGPGLGSVAEGVLLMHETAKSPAIGMSIAQFRHGPVEAADRNFRAVVLGTNKQTAELDAAFANDLLDMGGAVRWLGPSVSGCNAPLLCPWLADLPARFQGILETIPLQVLAYRKAELMGLRPGQFRWAPLVTTTESGFNIPPQR